jgi:hypothetical protein
MGSNEWRTSLIRPNNPSRVRYSFNGIPMGALKKELQIMAQFREKSPWNIGLALAAVLTLMSASQARADIILNLISVTPVGSDFEYTYSVQLAATTVLHSAGGGPNTGATPSNTYFTLYDIPGLIAGSEVYGGAMATNSMHTEQNSGRTPVTESPVPPDSASVVNITTYWTGSDVSAPAGMPFDMGTFSFMSTNALGAAMLAFTAATQKLEDLTLAANNTGQVAGPGAAVSPIPEPGTLALLAMGLPVLGGLYYRRRK